MQEALQVPRVLVVDDEETMRFTLKTFLHDAGFSVTLAPDGNNIAAMLAENDFEVALVDRILPNGQDGVDLITRLKNLNPFCETILITAYPTFESAADTLRNGSCDYLVKPVTRDIVCGAVRKAAEASLRKKRERAVLRMLQSLAAAAPEPMAIFKESGEMIQSNPAFQKAYGNDIPHLFSDRSAFIPESDIEATRQEFSEITKGVRFEAQRETQRVAQDSEARDVKQYLFACRECKCVVAIYHDMTCLRTLEELLRNADLLSTPDRI